MSAGLEDRLIGRGKVREIYDLGADGLLLVASDRISAFDVVMPNPIPDKGRVLTGMTLFWLEATSGIVPNHLKGAWPGELPPEASAPELRGRAMLCQRLEMLPIECVVRGYLAGSGWKDYRATGTVSGHALPSGSRRRSSCRRRSSPPPRRPTSVTTTRTSPSRPPAT